MKLQDVTEHEKHDEDVDVETFLQAVGDKESIGQQIIEYRKWIKQKERELADVNLRIEQLEHNFEHINKDVQQKVAEKQAHEEKKASVELLQQKIEEEIIIRERTLLERQKIEVDFWPTVLIRFRKHWMPHWLQFQPKVW